MTINVFVVLFLLLAAVSTLLTEAIKKFFENKGDGTSASPNLIALIDAIVVGGAGTAMAYIFLGIAFTLTNCLAIVIMILAIWIGSMIGYDKVTQLIDQLKK